jgi:hypothetical protein
VGPWWKDHPLSSWGLALTPLKAPLQQLADASFAPFRVPSLLSFPDLAQPSTLLLHLSYRQHSSHRFCRILTTFCSVTFNPLFLSFLTCSATPFCCVLCSVGPIRVTVRPHVIHLSTLFLPHSTSRLAFLRRSYALYSKPGLPETFATSLSPSRAACRPPPTRNIHPKPLSRSQRAK